MMSSVAKDIEKSIQLCYMVPQRLVLCVCAPLYDIACLVANKRQELAANLQRDAVLCYSHFITIVTIDTSLWPTNNMTDMTLCNIHIR